MKDSPMAEDELDELLETIGIKFTVASNDEWFDKRKSEAKAAINAYTTNKIIEARIDENRYYVKLLKLNEKSKDDNTSIKVSLRKVFEYRLEALNHRKGKP
jgi:hypothetical protein